MSPKPLLRRTYGSQSSFKASELESPLRLTTNYGPLSRPLKRKLPIVELSQNIDNPKRRRAFKKTGKAEEEKKKQTLTQLHFTIDRSILRTCAICNLSYTHGAPADESLHKSHCSRFQKGIEWGKEDEKKRDKRGMDEVVCDSNIKLKSGETGRIIFVKPTIGGRLGHKASAYLSTMNRALSAPDLPPNALEMSKIYLFLLKSSGDGRERIIGGVVAQHIDAAMPIASQSDINTESSVPLIHVEGNMYCKAEKLPTPMGIPRLFVSSAYRHKGVAQALLSAAARTFIHGCELDPQKGEVAFSQPTSSGRVVMERWGKGGIRVYEE